ncbi:FhaA domain-containing protein [Actinomyces minihominis]|uniref:FhaA domain-containing protein n=1 Tax=Actinomyces minihominis TaxID=2002838 RepID=UPI000C07B0F6|nr:DUF3662 and FHA domain-containing protein [Actinomyces minihominis]
MGIFDRFENAVEKGVNSVFSKVFRSGLKPVDISSALHRVMDDQTEVPEGAVTAAANPVAPNIFLVRVANTDLEALQQDGLEAIAEELERDATQYADDQHYVLAGPVSVDFEGADEESTGMLEIVAEVRRGSVAPATGAAPSPSHPIIDVDGEKWLLTEEVTVIGRSSTADIQVDDSGVSRRHVEFRITPQGVILTDLGSTNGTFVEGHRVEAATLLDGNQITIGRTRILFWTHPEE